MRSASSTGALCTIVAIAIAINVIADSIFFISGSPWLREERNPTTTGTTYYFDESGQNIHEYGLTVERRFAIYWVSEELAVAAVRKWSSAAGGSTGNESLFDAIS